MIRAIATGLALAAAVLAITAAVTVAPAHAGTQGDPSTAGRAYALSVQGQKVAQQALGIIRHHQGQPCLTYYLLKPKVARLRAIVVELRAIGWGNWAIEQGVRGLTLGMAPLRAAC